MRSVHACRWLAPLIVTLCIWLGSATTTHAVLSSQAERTLETLIGRSGKIEKIDIFGTATPGVSASGYGRLYFSSANNRFEVSENTGAFVRLVGAGGNAPANATYIVQSAHADLSAEQSLGALTTGLLLNTVSGSTGTLSAYAGTSCTNQFPRSLNASGAATCASVANTDLAASVFANPTTTLGLTAVNGVATTAMRSDAAPALSQAIAPTWTGAHTYAQTASTGTVLPGLTLTGAAHTALTASTERFDAQWNSARTVQWATGALALQRFHVWQAPTVAFVAASTVTDTATVALTGAPVAGTNATLTNTHGLLVQAGAVSTATNAYGLTVNAPTGATNNYAAVFTGGSVGVKTVTPGSTLEVSGANSDTTFASTDSHSLAAIRIKNTDATTNNWQALVFTNSLVGGTLASIDVQNVNQASSYGAISLSTRAADGYKQRFIVTSNGNVGIATPVPGGTGAAGVAAFGAATAPSTSPADQVQLWGADIAGAGTFGLNIRDELGGVYKIGAGIMWASGTKPTCAAGIRGTVYYVAGGAGVLDTFEVCRKDAADAYAWVTLF